MRKVTQREIEECIARIQFTPVWSDRSGRVQRAEMSFDGEPQGMALTVFPSPFDPISRTREWFTVCVWDVPKSQIRAELRELKIRATIEPHPYAEDDAVAFELKFSSLDGFVHYYLAVNKERWESRGENLAFL